MTLTVTDMFCGAGGSSIGVTSAGASVRLAMNHWARAIETHAGNFPAVDHACEDVSVLDPRKFPATDILIASPECRAHSYAGGRPRHEQQDPLFFLGGDEEEARREEAERSRATMWQVLHWAEAHRYAAIICENVVQVAEWEYYGAWCAEVAKLGYRLQVAFLNSMVFGDGNGHGPRPPQSRDRWYAVLTRRGNPAPDLDWRPRAWCPRCDADVDAVQAWKRPERRRGRYGRGGQYLYRCPGCAAEAYPYVAPAATAIDWELPCPPIGARSKPLKAATMARIEAGLRRYGHLPALVPTERSTRNGEVEVKLPRPAELPMRTQTGRAETGLVVPLRRHGVAVEAGQGPLPTVVAAGTHHSLVIANYGGDPAKGKNGWARPAATGPLGTVTATDHHALLVAAAGNTFQRPGSACRTRPVTEPMRTVVGTAQEALLVPAGGTWATSARPTGEPAPTQTGRGAHGLLTLPLLVPYYRTGIARTVDVPVGTVTGHDRHALLTVAEVIDACGWRMLTWPEIRRAMAFPGDYQLTGNQRERVRQLGQAVTPPVMTWLFARVVESLERAR